MASPRPNAGPPRPPLTDERLRQLAYDPIVASNANEVAMAIELLELRQRAAESGTVAIELLAAHRRIADLEARTAPLDRYREAMESIAESSCLRRYHVRCWERHDDQQDWCYPCVAQYALDPWTGRETGDA